MCTHSALHTLMPTSAFTHTQGKARPPQPGASGRLPAEAGISKGPQEELGSEGRVASDRLARDQHEEGQGPMDRVS